MCIRDRPIGDVVLVPDGLFQRELLGDAVFLCCLHRRVCGALGKMCIRDRFSPRQLVLSSQTGNRAYFALPPCSWMLLLSTLTES